MDDLDSLDWKSYGSEAEFLASEFGIEFLGRKVSQVMRKPVGRDEIHRHWQCPCQLDNLAVAVPAKVVPTNFVTLDRRRFMFRPFEKTVCELICFAGQCAYCKAIYAVYLDFRPDWDHADFKVALKPQIPPDRLVR